MKKRIILLALLAVSLCLSGCAPKQTAESAAAPAETVPAETAPAVASEPSEMPAEETAKPASEPEAPSVPSCTITIRCDVLLDNMDALDVEKRELVPEDGCLLAETTVSLEENDTVFDVLQRTAREHKLQMEFNATPLYDSKYIEGIGNLYEMDAGALSGWTYSVNGAFPGVGLNLCPVADGDAVQILYTCDLGADVGNEYIGG